jgi:hypothetical protein
VIEIHSAMPPGAILDWLSSKRLTPAPVLYAGLGRLQLFAAPDSYRVDRYDTAAAAILYLAPGSLILLPPSHLVDGQSVTWLRAWTRALTCPTALSCSGHSPSCPPTGARRPGRLHVPCTPAAPPCQHLVVRSFPTTDQAGPARGGLAAAVLGRDARRGSCVP